MTPQWRRVSIIYRKELLDIVRDRRTLIAMVAAPVLLYPLLMIGMAHAFRATTASLEQESYRIGVGSESDKKLLEALIARDLRRLAEGAPLPPAQRVRQTGPDQPVTKPDNLTVVLVAGSPTEQIEKRSIHAFFASGPGADELFSAKAPAQVRLTYDEAEIRSKVAARMVREMLQREAYALLLEHLKQGRGTTTRMAEPIQVEVDSVAPPEKIGGSVLGTIVPMLLVLMTLTGAIYPAIDLTAGERERGTLETLLAAPTAPTYLVAGKFLVVSTIAMITAVLNLASLALTLQLSGLSGIIAGQQAAKIPLSVFPMILVSMVPFAILSSAILLAVASFARTFKEAQNYMAPVMMAVLVPAGAGSLPGIELTARVAVTPVLNMVLLTRELLLGHFDWTLIGLVLVSTSLYAAAAVAIAGKLFGTEAVMFADSRTFSAIWRRGYIKPGGDVSVSLGMGLAAVAFVLIFHGHQAFQQAESLPVAWRWGGVSLVSMTAFLGIPLAVCWYAKIARSSVRITAPPLVTLVGAALIGLGSWAVAIQFAMFQHVDEQLREQMKLITQQLRGLPLGVLVVMLAAVPAVGEEFFFRGVLLGAFQKRAGTLKGILLAAAAFAAFHFTYEKLLVTFLMGVLLGWVCWRSGSIWPGMLLHLLHNGISVVVEFNRPLAEALNLTEARLESSRMLPAGLLGGAVASILLGLLIVHWGAGRRKPQAPARLE